MKPPDLNEWDKAGLGIGGRPDFYEEREAERNRDPREYTGGAYPDAPSNLEMYEANRELSLKRMEELNETQRAQGEIPEGRD